MNLYVLTDPRSLPNTRAQASANGQLAELRGLRGRVGFIGPTRPPRRGRLRLQSKNCASAKKEEVNARKRKHRQQAAVSAAQRLALLHARAAVARLNAQAAAGNVMYQYFECLAQGYDPTLNPLQAQRSERFLRAQFARDLKTSEFTGLDMFIEQWQLLSQCHASIFCDVASVEVFPITERPRIHVVEDGTDADNAEEESEVNVVKAHGVTTLRISRSTIERIFPHILADEQLVQQLVGRTYSFTFTMFAYVNTRDGRVFQLESKIDLTSALLELLQDPFVTMKMINATTMTKGGNLLVRNEVHEDCNGIENGFL
ncbi:hypothetical protein BBJ28_00011682 [Nothophytophthora sp. Chile5]|nr:hypothetical protein BBJ28_00011682 [Nothophytophthora sp. Chile5]